MTHRSRLELTDDLIERMVAQRAGSRAPADLIDVVMSATAATPQRRAPFFPPIALPRRLAARPAWVLIGALLALLALGVALVGSALLQSPAPFAGGEMMLVSQLDMPEGGSTFASPVGMRLFVLDAATGEQTPVADIDMATDSPYSPATWAKWSPDRTHVLAFDVDGGIRRIVDISSRAQTLLSSDESANGDDYVAWGPTGDRLVWTRVGGSDPGETLVIDDVMGTEITHLSLPAGIDAGHPTWSPDGSAILLSGCFPCEQGEKGQPPTVVGHGHAFVIPVDGSPMREFLDVTNAYVDGAVWSPDGRSIAASTPDGIAVVDLVDGRNLVVAPGHARGATWSPDGRRIAFTGADENGVGSGIFVVDADGSDLTQLTDGVDDKADWSPDGTSLVFGRESPDGMWSDVWIVPGDGGEARLLAKNATADTAAAVTPAPAPSVKPSASPASGPVPTSLYASWTSVGDRAFPFRNGSHTVIANGRVDITIGSAGIDIPSMSTDLLSTASLAGPDTIDVRTASTWPTWDCGPGITSTYAFSLSTDGRRLTLTPVRDDCPTRPTILKGDWIRTEMGELDAGRHVSALFRPFGGESGTFAYTVPAGWADGNECADCFYLSRTDDPGLTGVILLADVAPSTQEGLGCVVSDPGDKPTPDAIAGWLATLDGLVVTPATPVVIGGLSGVSVDVSDATGWRNPCSLGSPRDIFADPRDGSPTVYVEDETMRRYFILDRGQGQILLMYLESQASAPWDEVIAAAMPVIHSFEFTR